MEMVFSDTTEQEHICLWTQWFQEHGQDLSKLQSHKITDIGLLEFLEREDDSSLMIGALID